MSFYEEIADYYDFIFPLNNAQIDFIESCIEKPYQEKEILDVGCGTGDLVAVLAEMGFQVTGIDSDLEMLNRAESKIRTSATLIQIDMQEIARAFIPASFDIVLCLGNTLVHLTGPLEIESFMKQAKTILKNRGKLIVQILNYDHILNHNIRSLPLIDNNMITFERYYRYDSIKNLIFFRTILTVKESKKTIENEISLYPLRKHETDEMLRRAGFSNISYYGDFNKSVLKKDSLPLVVEAS